MRTAYIADMMISKAILFI